MKNTAGRVGIHLNQFPLPSETFVIEQARLLSQFAPVFLARRLVSTAPPFECVSIPPSFCNWRRYAFALAPSHRVWPDLDLSLIHAHFGPNGLYALPLARHLKVPLVVSFHGYDATSRSSSLAFKGGVSGLKYVLGKGKLKREVRLVLAVSRFIESCLLDRGFPEQSIRQHYIGVDISRFTPSASAAHTLDIVCVGRLVKAKGQDVLLRAFALIAKSVPESRLVFIGDGAERASYLKLASELGVGERVTFHGFQSHEAVARKLSTAAVSVSPSVTNQNGAREALGLASLEASASGVPSLVSRSGGLPETVLDGKTGFVFPEGDSRELAERLRQLLLDEGLRRRMGACGRKHVEMNFSLQRQTEVLETHYAEALI